MRYQPLQHGPTCDHCGGESVRTVRRRSLSADGAWVFYLANVWMCASCGHEFCDDALQHVNTWAAESAADFAY